MRVRVLGVLPRPRVERSGHGTKVWYAQEVIGLLTVMRQLKRRGMKPMEIAQLIGQKEAVKGGEARTMASVPALTQADELETIASLGEEIRTRLPYREVVLAIFDTEAREGERIMVPARIVHLPKSWGQ